MSRCFLVIQFLSDVLLHLFLMAPTFAAQTIRGIQVRPSVVALAHANGFNLGRQKSLFQQLIEGVHAPRVAFIRYSFRGAFA